MIQFGYGVCQSCAHELQWLRAERSLFQQRADRQQALPKPRRAEPRRMATAAAALLAASVLLAVFTLPRGPRGATGDDFAGGLSIDPQAVIVSMENRFSACLVATPNELRPCGPSVPASFPDESR